METFLILSDFVLNDVGFIFNKEWIVLWKCLKIHDSNAWRVDSKQRTQNSVIFQSIWGGKGQRRVCPVEYIQHLYYICNLAAVETKMYDYFVWKQVLPIDSAKFKMCLL